MNKHIRHSCIKNCTESNDCTKIIIHPALLSAAPLNGALILNLKKSAFALRYLLEKRAAV